MGIQASYTPTILPGTDTPLQSFLSDGNIDMNAETVTVKANKAVIIATGGSTGNLEFPRIFDPRICDAYSIPGGYPYSPQDGSGEMAAMAVGASLWGTAQSRWSATATSASANRRREVSLRQSGHRIAPSSRWWCQWNIDYATGRTPSSSTRWASASTMNLKPGSPTGPARVGEQSRVRPRQLAQRAGCQGQADGLCECRAGDERRIASAQFRSRSDLGHLRCRRGRTRRLEPGRAQRRPGVLLLRRHAGRTGRES